MKILHTSDWHLGQHFMGQTRQAEHRQFCDWLVTQADAHQIDAIIIAGDIFDTGTPPSYAREQYNEFIVALHRTGTRLVVLGGNHDSVATLSESRTLLAQLHTQVIPGVAADPEQQVLVLPRRDGTPGAVLCAIPFIRARDVLQSQAGQSANDKQLSLQTAIHDHYRQLYAMALAKREALGLPLPVIATGHLTTVGASASDSVREIYVGALEAFPTSAFPPADYIALGHIHRPQKVGGLEHIRYSGSPLPLSFDEARQTKEVLLAEFTPQGLQRVLPLEVPRFRHLQSLSGTLAELQVQIRDAAQSGSAEQTVWLDITVAIDDYLSDMQGKVLAMAADLPVDILRIRRARGNAASVMQQQSKLTLDELQPQEVFSQRLQSEALEPQLQQQLMQLHDQVIDELRTEQA
ncbi:exonuclease subunit SbcD [Herbaspirillum autotrophicum]|uniref:exonuclease subunit SbcD n=1 Tax=Herbaspirillum autotrophicum TaxID=180195 RepID=UPI00067B22FA|nr:exonuclease subunit SbcD [Herbaspirillum autotrophicum]